MLSLYKYFEKSIPAITRHKLAPKGSATTPVNHSSTKVDETPKIASAPNQVAKTVAITTGKGRCLPAIAKSRVFLTLVATNSPIPTEKRMYRITNQKSIINFLK